MEVQGQTLYASVPRIAAMYTDLTYDIATSDEFEFEMQKMLRRVAASLRITEEVRPFYWVFQHGVVFATIATTLYLYLLAMIIFAIKGLLSRFLLGKKHS